MATSPAASFYGTGGTLRQDSPSYVEREADQALYEALLRGAHLTHPLVSTFRAASVRVDGDPATRISLDGDLRAHLPLAVSRHPSTVRVIVGSGSH